MIYKKEFYKLIEKFNEFKRRRKLTVFAVSETSGIDYLRVCGIFNGTIRNITLNEVVKIAKALGIHPTEINKIYNLEHIADNIGGCECYVGVYWNYEDSELITKADLDKFVASKYYFTYVNGQYCDRVLPINLEQFDFCPKCGKKIDWQSIMENLVGEL